MATSNCQQLGSNYWIQLEKKSTAARPRFSFSSFQQSTLCAIPSLFCRDDIPSVLRFPLRLPIQIDLGSIIPWYIGVGFLRRFRLLLACGRQ